MVEENPERAYSRSLCLSSIFICESFGFNELHYALYLNVMWRILDLHQDDLRLLAQTSKTSDITCDLACNPELTSPSSHAPISG